MNLKTEFSHWNRIKCFAFTLRRSNRTIESHFEFVFEENSLKEITWLSWRNRCRKVPFSKFFPSTRKRKVGVFKFLRFEERFWKALFLWRSTVDSRRNRSNNAVFSNFFGEVWKLPKKLAKMHARVQVVIRLSFVYDWFIRWCAFSKQVTELQNQSNPGLLWHKITP